MPAESLWVVRAERGLQLLVGAVIVCTSGPALIDAVAWSTQHGASSVWLPLLVAVGVLALLGGLWSSTSSGAWTVGASLLVGVTCVLGAVLTAPTRGWEGWWPVGHGTVLAVYLVTVAPHRRGRRWAACVVVLVTVALLARAMAAADEMSWSHVVVRLTLCLMVVLLADVIAWAVRTVAAAADQISRAQREARAEGAAEQARASRFRELHRFVHDEVIHTLRLIGMDPRDVPRTQARGAAVTLIRGLTGLPRRESGPLRLLDRLRELAPDGLSIEVRGPTDVTAPAQVAGALLGAVAEALRNVARHAGTASAEIDVAVEGDLLRVRVIDHGRGFDRDTVSPASHGVSESIEQRMADVGGRAVWTSRPGEGTTVELTWRPAAHDPVLHSAERQVDQVIHWLVVPAVAAPAMALVHTFVLWGELGDPVPAALAAAAVTAVCAIAGLRVDARPWSRSVSVVLCAVSVLAALGAGRGVPDGSLDTALYPLAGTCVVPCLLLLATRPLWEGLLGALAATAAVWWTAFTRMGSVDDLGLLSGMLLSPLIGVAAALGLVLVLRWLDREVLQGRSLRRRTVTLRQESDQLHTEVSAFLDHVNGDIRSFIAEVAGARLDPSSASVRATAHDLERDLREHLSIGSSPALKSALELLRQHGWRCRVLTPGDPPPDVDRACLDLARRAVDSWEHPAPPTDSLLSVRRRPRGGWVVSLMAHDGDERVMWRDPVEPAASSHGTVPGAR